MYFTDGSGAVSSNFNATPVNHTHVKQDTSNPEIEEDFRDKPPIFSAYNNATQESSDPSSGNGTLGFIS